MMRNIQSVSVMYHGRKVGTLSMGNADELYFRSGNSGGVRPKCLYTDAEGHWLVKFRHTYDPKNMGEIELWTITAYCN